VKESSGYDPSTARLRARRSEYEDVGNHAHNTLSAETQQVRIFYPFHPLHGLNLQVIRKPKRGDGAVCFRDPAGKRLKIPAWMLSRIRRT
jgi:hypothetical protein